MRPQYAHILFPLDHYLVSQIGRFASGNLQIDVGNKKKIIFWHYT